MSLDMSSNNRIMDNPIKLREVLLGKEIYMTENAYCYRQGKKQKYPDASYQPAVFGDVPMIPLNLLNFFTEEKISFIGCQATIGNDSEFSVGNPECVILGNKFTLTIAPVLNGLYLYLPATEVLEAFSGKKVTWDPRGALILADKVLEIPPVKFIDRFIEFRDEDLIYRYMHFENPTGYQMIADLQRNYPQKKHPRLILTEEDVAYIHAKKDSDEMWQKAYRDLIAKADEAVLMDNSERYTAKGGWRQTAAVDLQFAILDMSWAYLITKDEKYAKKGVEILEALSHWDNLHYEICNLIAGHWAQVVALGYDTFYDYMLATEQGRDLIERLKKATYELIIVPHINAYSGKTKVPHYITMQDNFSGVIGGGVMCLLIAMCDEEKYYHEWAYLLDNCLRTLEMAVCLYYPDGGYYESVGYSQYMLRNFIIALSGMKNCFGGFYGLDTVKGFDRAGYAFVYLQSTDYSVNYHDSDLGYVLDHIRDALAYLFDDPKLAALTRRQKLLGKHHMDFMAQFYNSRALDGKTVDLSNEPLDGYFHSSDAGAFQSSLDVPNPTFAGFHGGYTGMPHDMLDLGEFVFESDNTIWAFDLGGDDYGISRYFCLEGYRLYRKSPEGKNCIILNPAVDRDTYYGQNPYTHTDLILLDMNKPYGGMAAYDLTSAYERDVNHYIRGYYFGDYRNTFTVRDELSLKGDTELYWAMHTAQEIEIVSNKKAILKSADGKTLTVDVICNTQDYTLKVMDAKPLPTSAQEPKQKTNDGYRKLVIYMPKCNGDITITVKLSPDKGLVYEPISDLPIKDWNIPS